MLHKVLIISQACPALFLAYVCYALSEHSVSSTGTLYLVQPSGTTLKLSHVLHPHWTKANVFVPNENRENIQNFFTVSFLKKNTELFFNFSLFYTKSAKYGEIFLIF